MLARVRAAVGARERLCARARPAGRPVRVPVPVPLPVEAVQGGGAAGELALLRENS